MRHPERLLWIAVATVWMSMLGSASAEDVPPERQMKEVRERIARLELEVTPQCYLSARSACDEEDDDTKCLQRELETLDATGSLSHAGCAQRADLDADDKDDLIVTVVAQSCGEDDLHDDWADGCARGVLVLWGKGGGVLLGAGEQPALREAEVYADHVGPIAYSEGRFPSDLAFLRVLEVVDEEQVTAGTVRRPGSRFPCAAGVPVKRDVLRVSGSDAAVIWFLDHGGWSQHGCGF